METLTIKVNTRTSRGKQLVNLINEMEKEGSVKIDKTRPALDKVLHEIETGKIHQAKSVDDMFKKILG